MAEAQGPGSPGDLEALARTLAPGQDVPLPGLGRALVFPLGLRHSLKHAKEVATLAAVVDYARQYTGSRASLGVKLVRELGPTMLAAFVDLLADCTVVTIDAGAVVPLLALPHWHVPAIATAWIDASFGTPDKVDPWKQVMAKLEQKPDDGAEPSSTGSTSSSPAGTP